MFTLTTMYAKGRVAQRRLEQEPFLTQVAFAVHLKNSIDILMVITLNQCIIFDNVAIFTILCADP